MYTPNNKKKILISFSTKEYQNFIIVPVER